ncbi:DUF1566 domain-containing protein [Erythrobacter sp. NE805]|uniref:Lcl C-terminal domain-containing protein n=1 Tax=Erythrobacter sp. NE805 TaxID=3389875 RepID=UPI00396AF7DB
MMQLKRAVLVFSAILTCGSAAPANLSGPAWYPIVGTGQDACYTATGTRVDCASASGEGQDAAHRGHDPVYVANGNGTVSDEVTGLMWSQAPSSPMTFAETQAFARSSRLGGYSDWRVPTIRELYSLIDYRGSYSGDPATSRPYLDTTVFRFRYGNGTGLGDAARGRRPIDVQEWSATRYVGLTMGRDETVFGVNFADGRIKGYPVMDPANRMQSPNRLAVRLVRGRAYGINAFIVGEQTISDRATGLMWQRRDDGRMRSWAEALAYCNGLTLGGAKDWRLPNAKELHSIVDYTRSPAIDPRFVLSDTAAYLWSSTTHLEAPPGPEVADRPFTRRGELAVYAAIGPALGYMELPPGSGQRRWVDAHGAGAMRSDPKDIGTATFPNGFGPQHDDVRGRHLGLCVRDEDAPAKLL